MSLLITVFLSGLLLISVCACAREAPMLIVKESLTVILAFSLQQSLLMIRQQTMRISKNP